MGCVVGNVGVEVVVCGLVVDFLGVFFVVGFVCEVRNYDVDIGDGVL